MRTEERTGSLRRDRRDVALRRRDGLTRMGSKDRNTKLIEFVQLLLLPAPLHHRVQHPCLGLTAAVQFGEDLFEVPRLKLNCSENENEEVKLKSRY